MSMASRCDVCGTLYEDETPHTMRIDVYTNEGSWSDVELCARCSKPVMAVIKPALNDIEDAP